MATTIITQITDDLDGSPDATTVRFGFQGREYEIDLSDKNASALEKALQRYIDHARPAAMSGGSSRPLRLPKGAGDGTSDAAHARAWGRSQKRDDVTDRGRVKPSLMEAWIAAGRPVEN